MDISTIVTDWLPEQRWFAGKGRSITGVTDSSVALASGEPALEIHRVTVEYGDSAAESYLIPVTLRSEPVDGLSSALIGRLGGDGSDQRELWVYDALRDRDQTATWLSLLAAGQTQGPVQFHPVAGAEIPAGLPGDIISTEQSNTSLIYGDTAILKVFRRLEPGINPDVEIHRALASVDNPHIAPLLGSIDVKLAAPVGEEDTATAAMVQTFLPGATDGWSLATASVRDLYAEADLHAEEVGGDFAGESYRLGQATASVHADLARVLPTETADHEWLGRLAALLTERLDAAVAMVPQLGEHAPMLGEHYRRLATDAGGAPLQRVHGDLHLGQVLRTVTGWTILDFEGEPARSISVRRLLDSPLRDVAGMLRSFDYAALHLLVDEPDDSQLAYRAGEWADRNRSAYQAGYASSGGTDLSACATLLTALEADKAVYETVYEARMRPHWLAIPLRSFDRLASGSTA